MNREEYQQFLFRSPETQVFTIVEYYEGTGYWGYVCKDELFTKQAAISEAKKFAQLAQDQNNHKGYKVVEVVRYLPLDSDRPVFRAVVAVFPPTT